MNLTSEPVEKRKGISPRDFYRDYMQANRPVVLTDLLDGWPALGKWSPEMFAERWPDKTFEIDGKSWRLADLIDAVMASDPANPAPYLRNQVLKEHFPELIDDIRPESGYFHPNWMERSYRNAVFRELFHRGSAIELYIGGNGRGFPVLHWDGYHTHAFLMQFYGRKEFFVYGPEQSAFLYPREDCPNLSHCADIKNVDLERYPLFAKAKPDVFVLEPGETLFIPSGWWHTTQMLSPSISLSCNVGNRTNWAAMRRDLVARSSPLNRIKASAYLSAKGLLCAIQDLLSLGI
ncbi:MAG: hypothetical protein RL088_3017 [Verrucomicrobiota bacterium]|jgi:hypothetical protein